ncbi:MULTISPECIES: 3-(cis-5,6-dihydroxycyclohexa-1,3-dien-1-yl)propanoate dehydrogenase [Metallosphaera]|uniref:3-(Cis-5,6-dihydroxycyclohexa-1, 3-dien-1-yl)propanoate dehydrogenase n=1 Tax=Metallosphaera prunae TaxID=47304 RepID=A0A4D8RVZ0_METPR|nr:MULTISPECIES: 3-(cis-5,6-dihydroxycyclohexa-1,3-dien-1-yl)propanoate dehydrogenase [Metallosphaera]QCO29116.1 3-(cis-5,6-dihydroxycyclohexa-1,3-dien-1-yl)propanoate dehydrogenase [Metallosphaera prunae]BBL47304.1 3-phenylpropionate-dihydrodiol/cinnamic acid-dihydrodiol dehydrogenase [Metallosphaera sedula]
MAGLLEGKVAYFVGGGADICRPTVKKFVEEGAKVVVLDISPTKLSEFNGMRDVITIVGDATKLEDNEKAVKAAVDNFGKLDTLVGCSGTWDFFVRIWNIPKEKFPAMFDEMFSINVKTYLLATRVALDQLIKNKGSVIYTVSNAGFYSAGGGVLYTATKFAVRGSIIQLAYELAPDVRVNGVAPGGTITALSGPKAVGMDKNKLKDLPKIDEVIKLITPLQTVPKPEDYVWSYVFLASEKMSRTVTGEIIEAHGGLGIRGLLEVYGMQTPERFKQWADAAYQILKMYEG